MLECSFGFRPRRSAHDALQVLVDESWRGARWVAETDIADCFEAIPHSGLMTAIEERISDRHVLKLLRAMLRAGVMQDGAVRRSATGSPQGGVISPVLCNVYLHRLDRQWAQRGHGVLARYADDLLAICKTKREAENALEAFTAILAELGLQLKPAKTRIVHLRVGGEGVDFLGFHHRYVRGNTARSKHLAFLARWPSRQAMGHARQRIREITARSRLRVPVEIIVQRPQPVLARLGGLLPVRELRPVLRQDHAPCAPPPSRVYRPATQAPEELRLVGSRPPDASHGPDRPQRNHRRATTQPAMASGELNAGGEERRRAVCGRTACTVCARHDQQLGGASPLWRLMTPTTSRWQLLVVRLGGKEAGVRNRDPRNTWRGGIVRGLVVLRVEGGTVRASLHHEAKPDVIKGPFRKRGGCARKVVGLTRRRSPRVSQMPCPYGIAGWCGTAGLERARSPWRSQQRPYYQRDR